MTSTLVAMFNVMPRSRVLLAALLAIGLAAGAAAQQTGLPIQPNGGAAADGACQVAAHLVHPDFAMPHVASALAHKQLDIVVMGTASSSLGGAQGASKAYPARLQVALAKRFPELKVKVNSYAQPRETAAEMERGLANVIAQSKPNLVVWQTGTADAIRGVDPEDFRVALEEGTDTVLSAGIDLIFMNMQYSPRTESMIALGAYADAMRLVAMQHEVVLFDRNAIMKYWNEVGTFDLSAATKKQDVAERVHNCIGEMLADVIVESAKLTAAANKDIH